MKNKVWKLLMLLKSCWRKLPKPLNEEESRTVIYWILDLLHPTFLIYIVFKEPALYLTFLIYQVIKGPTGYLTFSTRPS